MKLKIALIVLMGLMFLCSPVSAIEFYTGQLPYVTSTGDANIPICESILDASAPNTSAVTWKITFDGSGDTSGNKQTASIAGIDIGSRQTGDIIICSGWYKFPPSYSREYTQTEVFRSDWGASVSNTANYYFINDSEWHYFKTKVIFLTNDSSPHLVVGGFGDITFTGDIYFNDLSVTLVNSTVNSDINKTIVCMGDSLTYLDVFEKGDGTYYGASYPHILRVLLPNSTIYNAGVSGDNPYLMLLRWDTNVTARHPDYVIILAGVNGVNVNVSKNINEISMMYDWAIANNTIPIACTVPPYSGGGNNFTVLNNWIKEEAAKREIPLIDFYTVLEDPDNLGHKYTYYDRDGLHATHTGYLTMATSIDRSIFNTAYFYADSTSGQGSVPVTFKYVSKNVTSVAWDFENDGIVDSTQDNPAHTYEEAGVYSVKLTVYTEQGNFSTVKTNYITIESVEVENPFTRLWESSISLVCALVIIAFVGFILALFRGKKVISDVTSALPEIITLSALMIIGAIILSVF